MKVLNRSDFINNFATSHNLEVADAEAIVKVILRSMTDALKEKRRIEIRGFGSFEIRKAKPRKARNPKTGEVVYTNERSKIHFKSGKEMHERLNENN